MSSREANIILEAHAEWRRKAELAWSRGIDPDIIAKNAGVHIGHLYRVARDEGWGDRPAGKIIVPSVKLPKSASLSRFIKVHTPTVKPPELDIKELKKKFQYDATNGRILNKETGEEAGKSTKQSSTGRIYRQIPYRGFSYPRAHIIWALEHGGKLPQGQLTRIDGRSMNDRIKNLADIVSTDRDDFYSQLYAIRAAAAVESKKKRKTAVQQVPYSASGGAYKGHIASTYAAMKLDQQVADAAYNLTLDKEFVDAISKYGIRFQSKLEASQIPGGIGSCKPDGGVWVDKNGVPVVAFEAKKQGSDEGEKEGQIAAEGWYKNEFILRTISPKISYVTFVIGKGEQQRARDILNVAVLGKDGKSHFNELRPNENSIFLTKTGFQDDFLMQQMKSILLNEAAAKVAEKNAIEVPPQPESKLITKKPKGPISTRKASLTHKQDELIQEVAFELENDPAIKSAGITLQRRPAGQLGPTLALDKKLIPGGIGGAAPDGGIWMKNNKVVAAFEMKTHIREDAAAATWRWYKNHYILRKMNPDVTYVTFAAGPAARPRKGNKIHGIEFQLSVATLDQNNKPVFNKLRPHKNSVFQKPLGFNREEIKRKMKEAILKSIA